MEPNEIKSNENSCETMNVKTENMKNIQHIVQPTSGDNDDDVNSDSTPQDDDGDEFDFSESDLEDLDNEKTTDNRIDKTATNVKSESAEPSLSTSGEGESIDSSCPASSEDVLAKNNNNNCENTNNNNESDIDSNKKINKSTLDNINSCVDSSDAMSENFLLNESFNTALVDQLSPNTRKSIENIADVFFEAEQQAVAPTAQRRRSSVLTDNYYDDASSDEDDGIINNFLGKSTDVAEARLAARRQARAEAREIRMRELERQQKEQEQNADRVFDMQQASGIDPIARSRLGATNAVRGNSLSSRRSSEDSLEEEGRSLRDLRHELKDVEERFRKAMIGNAQLDNDRASQSYQIQLLKDKLDEMEESHTQLQREYRDKCRDHDALKRNNDKLKDELKLVQGQLTERDTLIAEQGLVIVMIENDDGTDAKRALVTVENAHLLGSTQGSLDVRLKRFTEEKLELQSEVQKLSQQLADIKNKGKRSSSTNGPIDDDDYEDAQREANKMIADYKYKLQKAEQEIASLQASLARSESQVIRYKSTADASEKAEADLKIERRRLQRENREASERLEELETSNNHLLKRLDKLKNAKSALLKDL